MNSPETEGAGRRRKILEAFDAVLDVPEGERDAWLANHFSADDDAVRAVKALIAADALAPSALPTELPGAGERTVLVAPHRIGPYRLEDILGAGGMGEVWRGVRDDGLFDQEVAVKLMRPSRYAAESLAFFDTERRALARLNHRHIARLFDGGVTDAGLPWFIMERVDGLPLHLYAAGRKPDRTEALKLILAIVEATQYAHQQLVVHADLKPSNILITPDGQPCLVDFGIASLAAVAAEQTDQAAFPSTPAYASPQRLEGQAPTPADDIYSLGLLIHGLLTGKWPEKPMVALLPSVGSPSLDAVINKACAADPALRYATAAALAFDIRAVLEHRPTTLQQGEWQEESRLFIRRHPRAVGAAVVALLGTMVALVLITGLYIRAEHERQRAQARFNDVRELAGFMLGDFGDELVKLPGASNLRARTTVVGRQYLERLSLEKDVPVDVLRDVAIGYGRVGNAEATTSTNATGNIKSGEAALAKSEMALRDLIRAYPARDDFKRELARTLTWKSGVVLASHNDPKAAKAALDEAFALYDGVLARYPKDVDADYGRWNAVVGLGDVLAGEENFKATIKLMQATLDRYKTLPVPPQYQSQRALLEAATENMYGDAAYYEINAKAGVGHYYRALELVEQARRSGSRDMRLVMRGAYYNYQLSTSYQDMGQLKRALVWATRGKALADDLARFDDSTATLHIRDSLSLQRASVLGDLGRTREALLEAEANIARRRATLAQHPETSDNRISLASGLNTLRKYYVAAKQPGKACSAARESLATFDEMAKHGGVPERNKRLDIEPQIAFLAACAKPH